MGVPLGRLFNVGGLFADIRTAYAYMSLTNETIVSRVAATISALEKMSEKDLLATPNPQFVEEYNRTRAAFVALNPTFAESAPPEILDQCRYVEMLAYSKQLQSLLRKIWLKEKND